MNKRDKLFQLLKDFDSEVEIKIEEGQVHISSKALEYDYYFDTYMDGDLNILEEEINNFVNIKK
ncbi:hypothetical protein FDF31_11865 [Clostridium sporogenes]|nr:hypothetical protein [Clostridium sporogenes]NFS26303.1 hypothetical protein [Clostridium sporogenes]